MVNSRCTRAYFYVLNFDCDHSEITKQLGFSPTEARNREGPSAPECISMWRHTVFAADSPEDAASVSQLLSQPTPISSCLATLIDTLESHADSIATVGTKYQVGIHCSGEFGVALTVELLNRLASIGVRFDFACNNTFDALDDGPVA